MYLPLCSMRMGSSYRPAFVCGLHQLMFAQTDALASNRIKLCVRRSFFPITVVYCVRMCVCVYLFFSSVLLYVLFKKITEEKEQRTETNEGNENEKKN